MKRRDKTAGMMRVRVKRLCKEWQSAVEVKGIKGSPKDKRDVLEVGYRATGVAKGVGEAKAGVEGNIACADEEDDGEEGDRDQGRHRPILNVLRICNQQRKHTTRR